MSEQIEKQAIEEMAKETMKHCEIDNQCGSCEYATCNECLAEALYNAGYRKPIEGEWIETDYKTVEYGFVERRGKAWLCTNCRHASKEFNPNMKYYPNCGAHMKGGAE